VWRDIWRLTEVVSRDADGLAEAPRRAGDVGDLEEAPRRGARWPGGGAVQGRLAAWLRRRAHSAVAGRGNALTRVLEPTVAVLA